MDLDHGVAWDGQARPTEVRVNLSCIEANAAYLLRHLTAVQKLMAVVKADGYGHGAVKAANAALRGGATWLGVALAEEGVALREQGIAAPICILGPSCERQVALAVAHGIDITLFSPEHVDWALEAARHCGLRARVHLKLDTGMGRGGLWWSELDKRWIERLRQSELDWVGVSTHFASSDELHSGMTRLQLERFLDGLEYLRQAGSLPREIHAANSAAILRYPGSHFTMVRAGLALYGMAPMPSVQGLKPALQWVSQVVYVKSVPAGFAVGYGSTYQTERPQTLLAIPVGYADGYRRAWSNRGRVLVGGRRWPVVGRVSMDQITVAVDPEFPVAVGDPVILLGEQQGERVTAEEMATWMDSISYEVVTGIGKRVPRRYVSGLT